MNTPYTTERFSGLSAVFDDILATHPGMGGALCVYHQCKQVVDLWGGVADARGGTAWAADTLTLMFSCTEGLMSVLIARLAQDGRLSFDTKVAEVWPELAAAGKETITVSELLDHRAGLPGLAVPITA